MRSCTPCRWNTFRRQLLRLRADTEHELAATPPANTDESARVGDQADQASGADDREFDWINRKRAQAVMLLLGWVFLKFGADHRREDHIRIQLAW